MSALRVEEDQETEEMEDLESFRLRARAFIRENLRPMTVEEMRLDYSVADGAGEGAGDVRSSARLGEELHPQLLALQDGGDVLELLLLRAELENDRRTRGVGRDL